MQSYNPENFSIQCAKEQNYEKFYETEIALRKQLKYPPFCDIIVVNFNSLEEQEIKKWSQWVYEFLKNKPDLEPFRIFKQNRIRYRIIMKGNMTEDANQIFNECLKEIYSKNLKTTRITIDVNPNNMM